MKLKITEFLGVMLTALVTGVFWGTWFTLTRSLENFPPAEFIHIGKTIIANVAMPMRFIMPVTLLIMLLAIWQCFRVHKTSFYLYLFSFLLMVITLIITVGIEVPIDNQIKPGLKIHCLAIGKNCDRHGIAFIPFVLSLLLQALHFFL